MKLFNYLSKLLSRSYTVLEEYNDDEDEYEEEECPDSPDPYRRKEDYIVHLKSELGRMQSIYKNSERTYK